MLARAEGRRLVVHRALKAVCEQADVRYFGAEDGLAYFRQGDLCADGIHPNAGPHARMASQETTAILAAVSPGQLRPVTTPRPSK